MNVTKVSVTEKHIAEGRACSGSECPIALAVLEALAAEGVKVARVMVDSYDVAVEQSDAAGQRKFRADLPGHATAFVGAFDEPVDSDLRSAEDIAPFEMELAWQELAS